MLTQIIFSLVFGLLIGSFINAVVWRLHQQSRQTKPELESQGLSITKGHSMCPHCRHELAPIDLIPVLSWIWLKGRCRYCGQPISIQYPLVEVLTGGLYGASYILIQPSGALGWLEFGFWLYLLTSLIILAVYDIKWMLLPDVVLLPAVAVTGAYRLIQAIMGAPVNVWLFPVLAAFLAGGVFYALAAVSQGKWMGGGDIKLVFLMGIILGLQKTALALLLAFNMAAVVSLCLIAVKALRHQERPRLIPFGPFLAAATGIAYLYGAPIINWYIKIALG
jgi:prepilin signal peptidase PulO-like enzyme (type II secretory pathway)